MPQMTLFEQKMKAFLPKTRCLSDPMHTLAWGTDAGFYRFIPKMVLFPKDESEMATILREASQCNVPLTFRASGTALSGQSVTDSVLVVVSKSWEKYYVSPTGESITLQPGILGEKVNEVLKPYGRKFSPDPASIKAARVGGIIANNASGMNCGTHANSDKTLLSAKIILADGTIIDTANTEDCRQFRLKRPRFMDELESIRLAAVENVALRERIAYKYSIKNVTGLNLLPLITYTNPFEMMAHLMVGSEGTLGFLAEATMSTEKIQPFCASAMAFFPDIVSACRAVQVLRKQPVVSAELLDRLSLRSVEDKEGIPSFIKDLDDNVTAVLLETKSMTQTSLEENMASITKALDSFQMPVPFEFTQDPAIYGVYWNIRSGIFPSVGGMRPVGSSCLIEDVAFHLENLPEAVKDLQEIIANNGYADGVIYGHALEGNFHFILNQRFDTPEEVNRYQTMMDQVVGLVIDRYDGSLKAEHGTGRNMAPFVEREWGSEAFELMRRLKHLFDPHNILNPGVIFNDDPNCYIKNIKALPAVFPEVDKCMECGFCEPNCVTAGFVLSSRQRIVVQREIARLRSTAENPARLKALEKQFSYAGRAACAGDGLCATSCPMGINTGEMIHRLRGIATPPKSIGQWIGRFAAKQLSGIKTMLRGILVLAWTAARVFGLKFMAVVGRILHSCGIPLWSIGMPKAFKYKEKQPIQEFADKVVYFPSCINQTMGPSALDQDQRPLMQVMIHLLQKAGYQVILPQNREKLCCGTIWESKGMEDIANAKTAELEASLWEASAHGLYPIVCDQSPCLYRMRQKISKMKLYEPAEFIEEFLVPRLEFTPINEPVALHITCSTTKMGLSGTILRLAERCSSKVIVPKEVGCCAFAGDKGFTRPEINAWALRRLREQVVGGGCTQGVSNSRTCEIGLTTHSTIPYSSIVYLVDTCTRPK